MEEAKPDRVVKAWPAVGEGYDLRAPESNPSAADAANLKAAILREAPALWDKLVQTCADRQEVDLDTLGELWRSIQRHAGHLNGIGQSKLSVETMRLVWADVVDREG